eukprot:708994_1
MRPARYLFAIAASLVFAGTAYSGCYINPSAAKGFVLNDDCNLTFYGTDGTSFPYSEKCTVEGCESEYIPSIDHRYRPPKAMCQTNNGFWSFKGCAAIPACTNIFSELRAFHMNLRTLYTFNLDMLKSVQQGFRKHYEYSAQCVEPYRLPAESGEKSLQITVIGSHNGNCSVIAHSTCDLYCSISPKGSVSDRFEFKENCNLSGTSQKCTVSCKPPYFEDPDDPPLVVCSTNGKFILTGCTERVCTVSSADMNSSRFAFDDNFYFNGSSTRLNVSCKAPYYGWPPAAVCNGNGVFELSGCENRECSVSLSDQFSDRFDFGEECNLNGTARNCSVSCKNQFYSKFAPTALCSPDGHFILSGCESRRCVLSSEHRNSDRYAFEKDCNIGGPSTNCSVRCKAGYHSENGFPPEVVCSDKGDFVPTGCEPNVCRPCHEPGYPICLEPKCSNFRCVQPYIPDGKPPISECHEHRGFYECSGCKKHKFCDVPRLTGVQLHLNGTVHPGSSLLFSCEPGKYFNSKKISSVRSTCDGGDWVPPLETGCKHICENAELPNVGTGATLAGDSLTIACPDGKVFEKSEETSKTVSCLDSSAGAKWSVVGMKCACQCPSPPLIPGTVEASTNNHGALTHLGARFTYHCAGAAYFDMRALTSSTTVACALQGGQCRWKGLSYDKCSDIPLEAATKDPAKPSSQVGSTIAVLGPIMLLILIIYVIFRVLRRCRNIRKLRKSKVGEISMTTLTAPAAVIKIPEKRNKLLVVTQGCTTTG